MLGNAAAALSGTASPLDRLAQPSGTVLLRSGNAGAAFMFLFIVFLFVYIDVICSHNSIDLLFCQYTYGNY